MPEAGPVLIEEYEARLRLLRAPRRYAVAISGGRDSMALARLAAAHAASGRAEVEALIVDHGLRPESAGEARRAKAWCETAGLPAHLLPWTGEKPKTAVQEAARSARYRLLVAASEALRCEALLTAHTADDQAETVFMRLARGAGRGLAAMQDMTPVAAGAGGPLPLLRPFLWTRRCRLEATLSSLGQPYLDDPSNDDPKFERVRVRALLAALEEQQLLPCAALLATAARASAAAAAADAALRAEFDRSGGCFHRLGYATAAARARLGAPLLARLVRCVAGGDHPLTDEEAGRFGETLAREGAATLGGALGLKRGDLLFVMREPAAVLGRGGEAPMAPRTVEPKGRLLWDRRFIIQNHAETAATIAPLGLAPARARAAAALCGAPLEAMMGAPAALIDGEPLPVASVSSLSVEALAEASFRRPTLRFMDD